MPYIWFVSISTSLIKALTALVGRLSSSVGSEYGSKRGFTTVSSNPKLFVICVNSADPDQTPRSKASDLGLHFLPMSQSRFYR